MVRIRPVEFLSDSVDLVWSLEESQGVELLGDIWSRGMEGFSFHSSVNTSFSFRLKRGEPPSSFIFSRVPRGRESAVSSLFHSQQRASRNHAPPSWTWASLACSSE